MGKLLKGKLTMNDVLVIGISYAISMVMALMSLSPMYIVSNYAQNETEPIAILSILLLGIATSLIITIMLMFIVILPTLLSKEFNIKDDKSKVLLNFGD